MLLRQWPSTDVHLHAVRYSEGAINSFIFKHVGDVSRSRLDVCMEIGLPQFLPSEFSIWRNIRLYVRPYLHSYYLL